MISSYHKIEEDTTDISTEMEINTINTDDHHDNAAHGKSIYKGVYKCGRKFKAQIQIERVQHYLGLFDNEIEAAVAYDNHARILLGKRARTNFVYSATASNEDEVIMSEHLIDQQNSSIQRMETKADEGESKPKRKRGYAGMQFRPIIDTLRSDEIVAQHTHWERNVSVRRYDENKTSPSSSKRSPKNSGTSPKRTSQQSSPGNASPSSSNLQSQHKSMSKPPYPTTYGQTGSEQVRSVPLEYNSIAPIPAIDMRGVGIRSYQSNGLPPNLPVPPDHMALWEQRTNQLSYMYGMPAYPAIPPSALPYHLTPGSQPTSSAIRNNDMFMANERGFNDRCDRTNLAISLRIAAAAAAIHSTITPASTGLEELNPTESSKASSKSSSSPPTTTTEATEEESIIANKKISTYWAGVLYIDPVSELQVWKGTYVECSDSTTRPTPMEFAETSNVFEYFTIPNNTISATGTGSSSDTMKRTVDSLIQNPQSGTMLGSYLNPVEQTGSPKVMLESTFTLNFQIINECNIHSRRYSALGSGNDEYGIYMVKGIYSTTSRVLELRKQYMN